MCSYKTWFHDDAIGYTVQCSSCQTLQIGFGNLMLTLSLTAFEELRARIHKEMDELNPDMAASAKCIIVPTPCESMNLLLSPNELLGVHTMLETVDTELKTQDLLTLFEA